MEGRSTCTLLALLALASLAVGERALEVARSPSAPETSASPLALMLRDQVRRQQLRVEEGTPRSTFASPPATTTTSTATVVSKGFTAAELGAVEGESQASRVPPAQVSSSASPPTTTTTTITTTTTTTPISASSPPPTTTAAANPSTGQQQFQYVKPKLAPKCHHGNQSYAVGQRWNDDCLQVCECVLGDELASIAISACRPRCPPYNDPAGERCTLVRSKLDECCLDLVCDSDVSSNRSTGDTQALPASSTATSETNPTGADGRLAQTSPAGASSPVATVLPSTTTVAPIKSTSRVASTKRDPQPVPTTTTSPPPTTTASHPPPTTTSATRRTASPSAPPATSAKPLASASRAPKQVSYPTVSPSQTLATESSAQRAQSPITTTSQPAVASGAQEPDQRSMAAGGAELRLSAAPTTSGTELVDEEIEPEESDLCIQADSSAYKLNQSWTDEGCGQTCRCVFRSEPLRVALDVQVEATVNLRPNSANTEIRCSLPSQCAHVTARLHPSADCPTPRLVPPSPSPDKCPCPRVMCDHPSTTFALTSRASTASRPTTSPAVSEAPAASTSAAPSPVGCRWRQQADRLLKVGEFFNDECHSVCGCFEDGEIRCHQLSCPVEPQSELECAHGWQLEDNFRPNSSEGRCCPSFVCKPDQSSQAAPPRSCYLMGKEIAHGDHPPEEIQPRNASCEQVCTCNDSQIVCKPLCAGLSDAPPEDLGCSAEQAYRSSDECCPRWMCPITEEYALKGFSVVPMNATAVEVTFVLPVFALNRRGRAELNYTSVALAERPGDQPPADARWLRRANIKTADGIFASQTVKYQLFNLKPEHKYWFKLVVHFSDAQLPFDEPLESHLQRAVMPALPPAAPVAPAETTTTTSTTTSTTTTTTTTSTTTPPPTRPLHPTQASGRHAGTNDAPTLGSASSPASSEPAGTLFPSDLVKPDVGAPAPPCSRAPDNALERSQLDEHQPPLPWMDHMHSQVNGPLQRYAWLLLVCLSLMTILFTIVTYLYLRRSSRVSAPISSQSAYDNPTFTKLVSYNQPHMLLVDESGQNFSNDSILAKQKNFELDKSSPLQQKQHQHQQPQQQLYQNPLAHQQTGELYHRNGRQHLI